jgi:serine O-acetyltransferase
MQNNPYVKSLDEKYFLYDKMSLCQMIKSDVKRFHSWKDAIFRLSFYSVLFYRLSHFFSLKNLWVFGYFFQVVSHVITGCEISHTACIGPGLFIMHPTGVHIGSCVKIGGYANLSECTTISANNDTEVAPQIGDHLQLRAGSRIFGSVIIGDKVTIGPNSVVFKNIGSNMFVLGNPARIFSNDFANNNQYKFE